jgi:hypothetical protein
MTNRKFQTTAALALLILLPQISSKQNLQAQVFRFKFDPKSLLKELLPVPPRSWQSAGPLLADDLGNVPEVHFQEPIRVLTPKDAKGAQAHLDRGNENYEMMKKISHQVAKINYLNSKKSDHFMEMLIENRSDLAGLPFVLGKACRLDKERGEYFQNAVQKARKLQVPPTGSQEATGTSEKQNQQIIAAWMQILAPELSRLGVPLVELLAEFKEKEADQALVRLALYSDDKNVRSAALKTLEKRSADIDGLLLEALTYPWPAVAKNAADAMVHLKRTDLVPDLVDFLDRPDPRLPTIKEIKGKQVPVVRELVRINHHRNCLLCHAPGNTSDVTPQVLIAAVPLPGNPFPRDLPTYFEAGPPGLLVRVDVTYLRQDFSRMQKVPDAYPWPEMQRFDFLVRTRILTDAEAKKYQAEFAKVEKNSPYRQAVLTALRALTGRDAEPTAAAWRKVLAQKKP